MTMTSGATTATVRALGVHAPGAKASAWAAAVNDRPSAAPPAGNPCLIAIVQAYMDRHGVSETEVARQIGVSRAAVNKWRNGELRQPPRRQYLKGLARLCGIDYADVLVAALIDTGYISCDARVSVLHSPRCEENRGASAHSLADLRKRGSEAVSQHDSVSGHVEFVVI